MLTIPLFVEILRTRPALLVWAAALAQAALWTLVPMLFFSAPPGGLPETIAVGHEFRLGSYLGPPLAHWLAELAFAGAGMFGVYLLSQLCIVVTYWVVFLLGRRIVGDVHAAVAVLLMVGVAVFNFPTPEFGPGILAMPLWALALLHYWQAVGEGRRLYWIAVGVEVGLLLLTTYAGIILFGLLIAFMLAPQRGLKQFTSFEPWLGCAIAVLMFAPHLIWAEQADGLGVASLAAIDQNVRSWAQLFGWILLAHLGLIVLVALALGRPFAQRGPAPELLRQPVGRLARAFVYFFALVPTPTLALLAVLSNAEQSFAAGPLVVLSGLAAVVAAGDRIRIMHQQLVSWAWAGLLVLPPLLVAAAVVLGPWFGADFLVAQPAGEMGRFFGESFARRTGRPLAIVAGDRRLAALVTIAAPSRPSLFLYATPERSPWVSARDLEEKGAILLWPTADPRGTPPAAIRERFPDIIPEVPPRAFERRFQGRLSLLRVGWAVIRPRLQPPTPPAPTPPPR